MRTDELLINLICLDVGIVPFCGGRSGHITHSLDSLPAEQKRKARRKFRKLLKKAIHHQALTMGKPGTQPYEWRKKMLRIASGLQKDDAVIVMGFGVDKNKITTDQSNLRAKLVRDYLRNLTQINT